MSMSPFRIVAFCLAGAALVVACSADEAPSSVDGNRPAEGNDGGSSSSSGAAANDGGDGSAGRDAASPSPGSAPRCETSDACPTPICDCANGERLGAAGVCIDDVGACDLQTTCEAACGGAIEGYTALETCESDSDCPLDVPTSCTCTFSGASDARNGQCRAGTCDYSVYGVCNDACGVRAYRCESNDECGLDRCPCGDGSVQIAQGQCRIGSCAPPQTLCTAACDGRGGYVPADEASEKRKEPGEACGDGSECVGFDCGCLDGERFQDFQACIRGACATKAEGCGFACANAGGWDGE